MFRQGILVILNILLKWRKMVILMSGGMDLSAINLLHFDKDFI